MPKRYYRKGPGRIINRGGWIVKIFLIRHGETLWNQEGRCQGISDIMLNERGMEQAKRIAKSLQKETIAAIYSSPLCRAKDTALVIAEALKIEQFFLEEDLKEINQGALEGITYQDLKTKHSELLAKWMNNPGNVQMPQGESLRTVQERAWNCLEKIAKKHQENDSVVVVSHNMTIMTILCKVLEIDLRYFRRLQIDIGAKTIIDFAKNHPVLIRFNDVSHLD